MKLLKLLLYGGIDKDDYRRIEGEIWKDNRKRQLLFSLIISLVSFVLFLASYRLPDYGMAYWLLFLIDTIASLITSLCLIILPPKKIILEVLLDIGYLLAYGSAIYIACVLESDRVSVSFIVYLILLPQIVGGRPIGMICRTLAADICFIICNLIFCSGDVLSTNLMNAVIFGAVSLVMGTFEKRRDIQRYLDEYKLRYLGDIDLLTGVNNRNAYEQNLSRYENICKKELNCIYMDVNGLHTLNNSIGHEAGDQLLRIVADVLKRNFRQSDIYRIGGDEFVVFVADKDFQTVEERIKECHAMLAEQDIFISYGVQNISKDEFDMDELLKRAEKEMYAAKEAFYAERGLEHR